MTGKSMDMATGTFIMAFHIASYVVMAHRDPFIVTLSKPFLVYSVNNSVIPFTCLVLYILDYILGERKSYYSKVALKNLSSDILNPVIYTMSMSDWFFRVQHFKYNGRWYVKDRAYMLEHTFNSNLDSVLDKLLKVRPQKKGSSE
ncbi:MAG: hypothetical protein J7L89_09455, partial [Bacteroidales bacterium]|nr:hypothetical protein [Bacteroidales bacterium]